ncbi:hypothetical protein P5673_013104 [Acropora cervicornis]|uniref:GRHL1/CP2 C-terminal domain-containing protein n=1 Tax=Acropora cervicornis TaxID=6130 RepID=A0AAD9QM02_ACRCE|nr:hypothetical protein P5673_013104 [Acropora cervicornis]
MDMVVKIMQAGVPTQFDLEKYSTPLLRHWREKGRKRTANEAFLKTADALVDLDLSPRIKRVVRRPPPALTIYVRRESEKAYNAIMLEEITTENLKVAVAMKYNTPPDTINSFKLRCKEGVLNISYDLVLPLITPEVVNVPMVGPRGRQDGVLHNSKVAGPSSEIDDKAVSEFTDEDTFLISLDYNAEQGLCNVVLESS